VGKHWAMGGMAKEERGGWCQEDREGTWKVTTHKLVHVMIESNKIGMNRNVGSGSNKWIGDGGTRTCVSHFPHKGRHVTW
jgi:hypothetical protein